MMMCRRSSVRLSRYTVLLGSYLRTGSDSNRVSRSVKLARNHPNFSAHYFGYDISVLTLSQAVVYSDYIRPVCLVSPNHLLTSSLLCYSTGWGLTDYSNSQFLSLSVYFILHTHTRARQITDINHITHYISQFQHSSSSLQTWLFHNSFSP